MFCLFFFTYIVVQWRPSGFIFLKLLNKYAPFHPLYIQNSLQLNKYHSCTEFTKLSVLSDMTSKFGQILIRTDTRLVFCNRKLMRTDIFLARTTKHICNFANPGCTIQSYISNLVLTMRSWNNLHQVRPKSKDWKA